MQPEAQAKVETGDFLLRKAVFLLTSSVGKTMAETLIDKAVKQIRSSPQTITKNEIKPLAHALEPSLAEFVGNEKAARLTSALRVLVGGITGI
jgi:hypothetical protein